MGPFRFWSICRNIWFGRLVFAFGSSDELINPCVESCRSFSLKDERPHEIDDDTCTGDVRNSSFQSATSVDAKSFLVEPIFHEQHQYAIVFPFLPEFPWFENTLRKRKKRFVADGRNRQDNQLIGSFFLEISKSCIEPSTFVRGNSLSEIIEVARESRNSCFCWSKERKEA